ncbi:hypothetical protein AJ78_04715 [Emergomyces pasteurianus Ep9510]|uniref:Uncharacterized protein n=1 Tax=Emergomyces pasteurianus Ep9510 TaxID=1447872 RepID=A0A1J9PER0_9EURO|nr:hypothetical protein AJ78_04715 [Emergomyces pasteurianus Ep9510]
MEENCNILFIKVYLSHANRVISSYVADEKQDKICRAKIEVQILAEIEKSNFPMSLRIAWVSMVVHTNTFDIYWLGQQDLHKLSKSAIKRIEPDISLADKLISPSPSTSRSSSREPSPLNSELGFRAPSDSETSAELLRLIPGTRDPQVLSTSPTKPTTTRKKVTPVVAAKSPTGVRKSRAPAKKKPLPATVEELEKSTAVMEVTGHENDSKPVPIDPELFVSTDRGATSPSKEAFKTSETAAPVGVLKTRETLNTSGRGGKKKNVRFDIPDV